MQAYKNDPTIFSWNLINEPRCDRANCSGAVQAWIEKQSAYLKSVDPNHLVTVGERAANLHGAWERLVQSLAHAVSCLCQLSMQASAERFACGIMLSCSKPIDLSEALA